jgi:antitoxin (DNA-binding transcriptional repressor) of toxin-antitoxin stability system
MATRLKPDRRARNEPLGVAEAKRRFSELVDRVGEGERFVVSRRGSPAVTLGPPGDEDLLAPSTKPVGLAAVAGALAEWDDMDAAVEEIYAARRRSRDRPAPELG